MAIPRHESDSPNALHARFRSIWLLSLKKYAGEIDDLPSSSYFPQDPDSALDLLLNKEKTFRSYREHGQKLRSAMKPVFHLVKSFSDAVGTAVTMVPGPHDSAAKVVFSLVGVLLAAAQGVSDNYNSIMELFNCLHTALDVFRIHLHHEISVPIQENLIETLAHMCSIFDLVASVMKKGRVGRYFKALLGKNSDIQAAFTKLSRLASTQDRLVTATTLSTMNQVMHKLECGLKGDADKLSDTTKEIVEAIDRMTRDMEQQVDEIKELTLSHHDDLLSLRDQEERRTIHQWLSSSQPSIDHNDNLKLWDAVPETGTWFFRPGSFFNSWVAQRGSFLWIMGGPGFGKSVLASGIIKRLGPTSWKDTSHAIAYYYFVFDKEKINATSHQSVSSDIDMLSSLVRQLSSHCTSMPATLQELYHDHCLSGERRPGLALLLHTLESVVRTLHEASRDTYIILDALDECMHRQDLIQALKTISAWKIDSLRILVTSRPELKDSLQSLASQTVNISDYNKDDIRVLISKTVNTEEGFQRWTEEKRTEIKEKLVADADGMFRWVACQLTVLRDFVGTPDDLSEALGKLPRSLDETYERILLNINEYRVDAVIAVLRWLMFSVYPLKLEEIAEVLAIKYTPGSFPRFDPSIHSRLHEPRDVEALCPNLITVTLSGTIKLSHYTVKEYLTSRLSQGGPAEHFYIDAQVAHATIADGSIAYLLQMDKSLVDMDTAQLRPLAPYAAHHWAYHLSLINSPDPKVAASREKQLLRLLDRRRLPFHNWTRLYNPDRPRQYIAAWSASDIPPPLYYSSLLGLPGVAKQLLARGADINEQGGRYGDALQAAAVNAHCEVVKLLLEKNAKVAMCRGFWGSALHAAAAYGHEDVLEVLLPHITNINECSPPRSGTPLHVAATFGQVDAADILLANGADIDARGLLDDTPLQAASSAGEKDIVQFLLYQGADPNAPGGHDGDALQIAAKRGYESIVRTLLNHKADPNASVDEPGVGSPLRAAAAAGHAKVVELLLERDAIADSTDPEGFLGEARAAAELGGHRDVLEVLRRWDTDSIVTTN